MKPLIDCVNISLLSHCMPLIDSCHTIHTNEEALCLLPWLKWSMLASCSTMRLTCTKKKLGSSFYIITAYQLECIVFTVWGCVCAYLCVVVSPPRVWSKLTLKLHQNTPKVNPYVWNGFFLNSPIENGWLTALWRGHFFHLKCIAKSLFSYYWNIYIHVNQVKKASY